MSLFNEFQNKNFIYLTKYINDTILGNSEQSHENLHNILVSDKKLTEEGFVDKLSNFSKDINENAAIFQINDKEQLISISKVPVPIRATYAERAWLYYYLDKPETKLFLDDEVIYKLKKALEKTDIGHSYPLNDSSYTVRHVQKSELKLTSEFIQNFKTILKSIHDKCYIITDNHTKKGDVYQNSKLIPFRIEYIREHGTFHLSAFIPDSDSEIGRSIKLNIDNLKATKQGDQVDDYEAAYQRYIDSLNRDYDKGNPLVIKVTDYYNGFDRTVFTLANYKRESYRDEDDNIIMRVYFRKFQERDLINKLLFLGPAITVLGPADIREKYVKILRDTYKNY